MVRLGARAQLVMELCSGRDSTPLAAYTPSRTLVEEKSWEEPVAGVEPLLFVLRGLVGKLSARLAGRGQAAQVVKLVVTLDRSIANLRGVDPTLEERFDLSMPLWRDHELFRVLSSRVERLKLGAPSLALRLEVPSITQATGRQLDLSRVSAGVFNAYRGLEELPVLLAELNADIGKNHLGVLSLVDDHRPESKSRLASAVSSAVKSAEGKHPQRGSHREPKQLGLRKVALAQGRPKLLPSVPTRLLPVPVLLDAPLRVGGTLSVGRQLYSIEKLSFECRLDAVAWWVRPTGRDYLRLWLKGPQSGLGVLAYVERQTGRRYLQAIYD
jgi:hypothetical protein